MRVAGFDELDARTAYLLWQLRESVFVVEQSCPYPELDGRDLEPGTRHVWAEYGGAPVAYLRLLEDHDEARIGRVLVAAGHRGRGRAAREVVGARDRVGPRPGRRDAPANQAGGYERYGYAQTGPEFLDDGIPHVPMRRPAQSVRTRP